MAAAQVVCREMLQWTSGAWHACSAHRKHAVHVCDAGRVEAQRLVERVRGLPSRKGGRAKRGKVWAVGGRGGGVDRMQRMARLEVVGARARTPNIKLILVTRDVSKFSGWLKADAVVVSIDRRGVVDVRDRRSNTGLDKTRK